MASTIATYPVTLPTPSAAPVTSAERRILEPLLLDARAFQRDGHAFQSLTFPALTGKPMTEFQADEWHGWWKTSLREGGYWFASIWPLPQGRNGIRRFIGPPRWEFIEGGFWRITAFCEVRGDGVPPVFYVRPLLSMHFDADFTDESGHSIAPFNWGFGFSPPVVNAPAAKFGGGGVSSNDFGQPLISDVRGALNLNEFGEWQIRFWANPTVASLSYTGGYVISLQGADSADGMGFETSPPGGTRAQIKVFIESNGVGFAKLNIRYLARDPDTDDAIEFVLAEVSAGSNNFAIGSYTFFAICGDATSTRAYIDDTLVLDDHDLLHPPGSFPLWYDSSLSFTNQVFIALGSHTGLSGTPGGDPWPALAVFANLFSGDVDDLQVTNGPSSVEFIGSTITVPIGPF